MAVDWVYWRPIIVVRARRPEREFGKIGFADDFNSRAPRGLHQLRIVSGRRSGLGQIF